MGQIFVAFSKYLNFNCHNFNLGDLGQCMYILIFSILIQFKARAKLYIPSTINAWKKLFSTVILAGKKWAGFWHISMYIK